MIRVVDCVRLCSKLIFPAVVNSKTCDKNLLNKIISHLIFIQKLFGHFPQRWPKMNTQRARENWGGSLHLQDFHLFGDHY